MHRVSRSIAPRCSKFGWDGCELTVFEYQGWPYEWPYSHLMMCAVWWVKDVSFVSWHWTGHIKQDNSGCICFVELKCLMRMDHVFLMDFRRLVLQSPSIIKKHWPEITKQMFRYLYDRLQKPPSRHWLFWLSYSLTVGQKQLHLSPEKVWPQKVLENVVDKKHGGLLSIFECRLIDYLYPETNAHLNICSWWWMVPCTRYCVV